MTTAEWADIAVKVASSVAGPLSAVLLAWVAGHRLAAKWGVWQKRRELAQSAANDFYRLYGEFYSVWKLWNRAYLHAHGKVPDERYWELLKRAAAAEANIEALMVKLTSERHLSPGDLAVLGRFRQAFQRLRKVIQEHEALGWNSSEHPEYVAFKGLASAFGALVATVDARPPASAERARKALEEITSNRWEGVWAVGEIDDGREGRKPTRKLVGAPG